VFELQEIHGDFVSNYEGIQTEQWVPFYIFCWLKLGIYRGQLNKDSIHGVQGTGFNELLLLELETK